MWQGSALTDVHMLFTYLPGTESFSIFTSHFNWTGTYQKNYMLKRATCEG